MRQDRPYVTENEKLANVIAGESTSRIMTLDGKTAEDVLKEKAINKFNEQVDKYVERLNEHAENLEEHAKKLADTIDTLEIMPIADYVLIRELAENPFQRIVRSESGLIIDMGGQKPQYKNTDNGEIEEEENIIKVGIIREVGPKTKWCCEGDTVMYTKMSSVPIPFYKQGLVLVNENRILVTINQNLTERFNELKKNE